MRPSTRLGRALRAWQTMGVPVRQPELCAEQQQALAEAIRRVPERRRADRRRRSGIGILVCAAAALLAVWAFVRMHKPVTVAGTPPRATLTVSSGSAAALVLRGNDTRFVGAETHLDLQATDEVSVPEGGGAELVLPSRASVEVAASTRLAVPALAGDEVIRLTKGRVVLSVPRLRAPHTLSVVTPDARAVVHGTHFSVTVSGDPPSTVTVVAVDDGEVAVLSARVHRVLRGGQSWSSDEIAARAPVQTEPDADTPATNASAKKLDGRTPPRPPRDELGEQNALYRAALAARNRGDDERAADLLGELLARHPGSPLATEAAQERARALGRLAKNKADAH